MIGAIIGDIVGSVHEPRNTKSTDFPLFVTRSHFTDDTVLTIATAQALLDGIPYDEAYRSWGRRYPHAGYGDAFLAWLAESDAGPYNSWGNGSAMRVSPIAFAFDTAEDVLREAERSAEVSHDHREGIKGAQAAALVTFLARTGVSKSDIRREVAFHFDYELYMTVNEIRPGYGTDVSCQGSVPEALTCFLDTDNTEAAIRAAVSLGGDSETQAAIAGAAAAAFDGSVPPELRDPAVALLPSDMREVLARFEARYPLRGAT